MDSIKVLEPIVFEDKQMRRTADGGMSVFDLIGTVGGQINPRKDWERLSRRYPEVVAKCYNLKFPGKGQRETPVAPKEVALEILGLLPGTVGQKYREDAAKLVLAWYESPEDLAVAAFDRVSPEKARKTKARIDGIYNRKLETNAFKDSGVVLEGYQYGRLTNATYQGLLGADAATLRKEKGIAPKDSLRDTLSDVELAAISLAELVAAKKISEASPSTFSEVEQIVSKSAIAIKQAIS